MMLSCSQQFNLVFIGAGNINFGSDEGPWDHSFRLEHKLGPRLKVVALIDPNEKVAKTVLDRKRNSFVVSAYKDTRICSSLDDFVSTMKDHERPHAFIVGSPAAFRGSTDQGRDVELQILKHFPKNTPSVRSVSWIRPLTYRSNALSSVDVHRETSLDRYRRKGSRSFPSSRRFRNSRFCWLFPSIPSRQASNTPPCSSETA